MNIKNAVVLLDVMIKTLVDVFGLTYKGINFELKSVYFDLTEKSEISDNELLRASEAFLNFGLKMKIKRITCDQNKQ